MAAVVGSSLLRSSALLPTSPALPSSSSSSYPSASPASKPGQEQEFVRGCCARTLYPRLSVAGLEPYAAAARSSHARLVLASANLALAALASLAGRIALPPPSFGALGDCAEAVTAAADETARAAELSGVDQVVGPEVMWRVGDTLMWLSAAMTYEETCL
ncbi:hypothetical protein PR202_ga03512 [Eleusine coracana subsp. coracana]|uniref:Pectinesterase inhibitor domain-containing protein n=1 Tax=Eleusine coracana subsp. coracana TaxID=191504 RepID=A0AAV5BNQ2_ELECO|nr:hypothetical protein PR202_ga03512 [Eleusine coracana subsp. coracana]